MRRSIFLLLTLLFSACNSGSASEPQTAISISEAKTTETITTSPIEDSTTTISNLPSTTDTQEPSGSTQPSQEPSGSTQPSSEYPNPVSVPAGPNAGGDCYVRTEIGEPSAPRIESIQISSDSISNQDSINIEVKIVNISQTARVNIELKGKAGAYLREMPWTKESSPTFCGATEHTFNFNKKFASGTPSGQYELRATLDGTYKNDVTSSSQEISYTNSSPDVDYPQLLNGAVTPDRIAPGSSLTFTGTVSDSSGLLQVVAFVYRRKWNQPERLNTSTDPMPGCRWDSHQPYSAYPTTVTINTTCSIPTELDPAYDYYRAVIQAYDRFGNWHEYSFDLLLPGQ
jgi:hypothetical protein